NAVDISENQVGTIIGNLSALNLQAGETVNYADFSISGDHADWFEITSNGELKLKDDIALDYENTISLELSITGYTSEGNSLSTLAFFRVLDINEAPSFTLSNYWIEDQNSGAIVGLINVIDEDEFDSNSITISGYDADSFEISSSGELKLKDGVTPDFASKSDYILTITVTDAAGATHSETVTIAVNAAPTEIILSNNSVDESHYGLEIGNINVTDPNVLDTFSYTLSGTDQNYFEVTADGVLKLKDDVYADYEMKDSYSLTVTATDLGGLSIEKTLTITVNDLNYATPY
ncbi:uncharacterized protein METZ01_LOCUS389897, partial [marine metagenome]